MIPIMCSPPTSFSRCSALAARWISCLPGRGSIACATGAGGTGRPSRSSAIIAAPRAEPSRDARTPRACGRARRRGSAPSPGFASSAPPVDDDRLDAAERVEHVRELVADALERGLRDVERRSSRTRGRGSRRAGSAFQPSERSPPRNGRKTSPCAAGARSARPASPTSRSVRSEPGVQVAAVGERAALAEAVCRRGGRERAPGAARPSRRGVDDAERRRRPDHHARPAPASCSPRRRSSRRRHRAPDRRRRPARRRPAASCAPVDPERIERLVVPVEPVGVEETGAARGRDARCAPRPRAGAGGSRRTRGSGPRERRRPAGGGSSPASRPDGRSSRCGGGSPSGSSGRRRAAEIAPGEHRRQRPVALVDRDERMPEAADRERVALADLREHGPAGGDELVGVGLGVGEARVAGLRHAVLVVGDGSNRGRADVQRDDPHVLRQPPPRARAAARRGSTCPRRPST